VVETVPGWPGVGLSAEEFRQVPHFEWAPNLKYSFAAGEAISRFLAEIKQGRLIARSCEGCGHLLYPPRMFCEECYRPTDAWVEIRDTGTIETFSVSYIDLDARRIKDPIFVGVIMLDGPNFRTREHGRQRMGMMHYFGEIKKDSKSPMGFDIRVGQRVKAVWKPAAQRTGSVLDIVYFRPMKPGEDPFPSKAAKPAAKPKAAKKKGGRP
jgi:uncharacterized OB-fold protein